MTNIVTTLNGASTSANNVNSNSTVNADEQTSTSSLKEQIQNMQNANASLMMHLPAVAAYKSASKALDEAKVEYSSKVDGGCLTTDATKQEAAMLLMYHDVKDMGAKAFMDPFYVTFLGNMAEKYKNNLEALEKRPITRESREEKFGKGYLNDKQKKFFANHFRMTIQEMLSHSEDGMVNAKDIKESVMNIFIAGADGTNAMGWMKQLYPNYKGDKSLKYLLERDADYSSTLKAICELGEYDYKVTKHNDKPNQHMIAASGFFADQGEEIV
jgi:hypothetical protein